MKTVTVKICSFAFEKYININSLDKTLGMKMSIYIKHCPYDVTLVQ